MRTRACVHACVRTVSVNPETLPLPLPPRLAGRVGKHGENLSLKQTPAFPPACPSGKSLHEQFI